MSADNNYLDVGGFPIHYRDMGDGDEILLCCHCSSASSKEWLSLAALLGDRFRLLIPDFADYGKSGRIADHSFFNPHTDIMALEQLLGFAEGRAIHLLGHSYGGAMALELAQRYPEQIKSLVLFEPVAFHLLRNNDEKNWQEVHKLAGLIQQAYDAGHIARAARYYMAYWIGNIKWWLMPVRHRQRVCETMQKVCIEFSLLEHGQLNLDQLEFLKQPALLLHGSKTRHSAKSVSRIIHKQLPHALCATVDHAGHMAPLTHSQIVNRRIVAFYCDNFS